MSGQILCHEEWALLSRMAPLQICKGWGLDAWGAVGREGDNLPPTHNVCLPDYPHTPHLSDAITPVHAKRDRRVLVSRLFPPPHHSIPDEAL